MSQPKETKIPQEKETINTRNQLAADILTLLYDATPQGLTAQDLLRCINSKKLTKAQINSILYNNLLKNQHVYMNQATSNSRPIWYYKHDQ